MSFEAINQISVHISGDCDMSSEMKALTNSFAELTLKGTEDKQKSIKCVPESACSYCDIDDPTQVIKCKVCQKWFCNGKRNVQGSHAVNHLTKAKHKEICLHKDGSLGDRAVECSNCGSRNVFTLGVIRPKANSEIVLLCRQPCADQKAIQDISWDEEEWKPLINDRTFITCLVKRPTKRQLQSARQMTTNEINKLEEQWKHNSTELGLQTKQSDIELTFQYLNTLESPQIRPVLLTYHNGDQYRTIFKSLIKMEADYLKMRDDIQVRWKITNKQVMAFFTIPNPDNEMCELMRGDQLKLIYKGNEIKRWSGIGDVFQIPDKYNEEVGIVMKGGYRKAIPIRYTSKYAVEFLWESVSYERMKNALNKFAKSLAPGSQYIYHKLLGHQIEDEMINETIPEDLSAPNLPKLNQSQENAVKHSVQSSLSLIQGPPGTGKTVTSATIAYHLAKTSKTPILVCAQSNIAVDQLTEKICKTGLNVIRVCSRRREENKCPAPVVALHNQILKIDAELHELQKLKDEKKELTPKEEKRYKQLKRFREKDVLKNVDVICCTCITAGDPRLAHFKFTSIIIDESMQATEPECMVPIAIGVKQLILVGDHKQLGPVVKCKEADRAGLSQSLFERLVGTGIRPLRLQIQYRMHPSLSKFPSDVFYNGSLQNGVFSNARTMKVMTSFWPQPHKPMFFYSCKGQEELDGSGTSFLNRKEASIVEKILSRFRKCGIKWEQIGVITPYDGQRQYLVNHLKYSRCFDSKLEVASVNAFQGREKDLIIFSCVRSNEHNEIGFLRDPRRLNVAITRARYGLIIIGNPKTLLRDPLWNDLLTFYKKNRILVEGSLNYLKESQLKFNTTPKK